MMRLNMGVAGALRSPMAKLDFRGQRATRRLAAVLLGGFLALGTACGGEKGLDPVPVQVKDVVIVGGGIAGLTAAHLLKGQDVLLLEKESVIGGRAVSGTHPGIVYAKGTEYLGELEGALARLAKDVSMEPFEIPAPMDAKIQDSKLYVGEESITRMIVDRAGIDEYNRFVSTVQQAAAKIDRSNLGDPEVRRLDKLSTLDWFKENRFAPIFSDYYNVSCRGLFGASIGESSALCMIPEIGFDYTDMATLSGGRKHRSKVADEEGGTDAFTFRGGISTLCEGVAKKLGERVQSGCAVLEVKRVAGDKAEGFLVTYKDRGGQTQVVASKAVILAVPAPVTLKLGGGALTEEQKTLMTTAEYAPYMTVALFSATPIFNQAFDLAVPDGMFFTDLYPGGWAENGKMEQGGAHVLSAYVAPKSYKDNLLGMTDDAVHRKVLEDLERLFPGAAAKVTGYDIHRFPYGYPVMTVGAYERMDRLTKLNGRGLILAGDYLTNPTFDAAAESGATAAEQCEAYLDTLKK